MINKERIRLKAMVMANARRIVKEKNRMTNCRLYMKLFSCPFTIARKKCIKDFGLDPHGNETSYTEIIKYISCH